jgi:hypothetical protein
MHDIELEIPCTGSKLNGGCRPKIKLDGYFLGFAIAGMTVFRGLRRIPDLNVGGLSRFVVKMTGLTPNTIVCTHHARRKVETQKQKN